MVSVQNRYEEIVFEREGDVAKITLNKPDKVNPLSIKMSDELRDAIEKIRRDPSIRFVVFRGAGGNFSAGDDISEFDDWGDSSAVIDRIRYYQDTANIIEDLDKITIAAVQGYAVGGGLEVTMVCDFVIAEEGSMFGMPEIDIGITPGWGGTQRLVRLIGRRKTKELIYLGSFLTAEEALDYGLVNKVVKKGELDAAVNELLDILRTKSPLILKLAKLIIQKGVEADLRTALAFEALSSTVCWTTDEKKQSCRSFVKKQDPWVSRRRKVLRSTW
ncbi:MAG: enoyl-CoA hydratase/isomerase family protein [Aigarchaeota archaeon]|nr:enoyl-CoA hydratase/isomerase family protein [Aigarchaeota archaeon]MDW8092729.1 enoyl-CoA hydratase/isomerase family protein [Nitrososphaerota archaeon]